MDDREYTLMEHLQDLRRRVVRAAIGVAIVSFAAFSQADAIISLLRYPLDTALLDVSGGNARFVVIAPAEYFIAQLKAALVAGIFISSPWALYQLWLFISPGLYEHEQRWASGFVVGGAIFFVLGGLFAYFFAFPGMFRFFLQATIDAKIEMTLSIAEHLSFSLKMLLAFGLAFQTPVIVFVLSMAGIVDPNTLTKYRSYVIVGAFILGAILTPPDVLSQTLLSIPLILLFEVGILVSRIVLKLRPPPISRAARAEARADAAARAEAEAVAQENASSGA